MSADAASTAAPRRFRWLQFSLRTLLLVMLVAAIGVGWWSERIRRQQRIAEAVRLLAQSPNPYGWNHDPIALVRAVNSLRSLGKRDAIAALRQFVAQQPNDSTPDAPHQALVLVVPLLFERCNPEDKYPRPTTFFRNDSDYEADLGSWPFRLAIQNDIPYQNVVIGIYTGAESDKSYLIKWAAAHGRLRGSPLRPGDDPLSAADQLIHQLHSRSNDAETGSFVVKSVRRQAVTCIAGLIGINAPTVESLQLDDDDLWKKLKQDCIGLGIRWSEQKQQYVATKGAQ
jgi:hypothetical protein